MATMNVSLPDPMKQWVEAQARTGRYSNASDYVRDLIRKDQERAAQIAHLIPRYAFGHEERDTGCVLAFLGERRHCGGGQEGHNGDRREPAPKAPKHGARLAR